MVKLEDVLCCWRGGGAHRGNGCVRSSTTATERTAEDGGAPWVRTVRERGARGFDVGATK
jgi:hypothetical protein